MASPNLFQIQHQYTSPLDQQKAKGIQSMAWGTLVGTLLGSLAQFSSQSARPLFMIGDYPMGPTHVAYVIMSAMALIGLVGIQHSLNRGKLQLASIMYVTVIFAMMVLIYAPNLPNSVMVAGFALPVVAAGVLLHRRGLFITIGLVCAVIVGANLAYDAGVAAGFYYGVPVTFDAIMLGLIAAVVSGIMLNVFAGNQRVLLEQNITLNQDLKVAITEAQDMNAQLRESELRLEERVAARTEELRVALARAEEADRIKSQFLASMSHELRTPLNAILNFSKLMRKGVLGEVNERQVHTLNEVVASGQHLLNLINDVLDISKMQSSMLSLFVEENVDLYPILRACATTVEALIKDKPVALVEAIDPDLPLMLCDRRRVQQILLNLLANAAKFTDQGTITLSASRTGDRILFAVKDTGAGIPEDHHELIFEPFVQTETGVEHTGGTGLGLAICRNLVEAHDGEISLNSTPGEGSTFAFALPIASPRLRQQLPASKESAHV